MRFHVLGPVRVTDADQDLTPSGRQTRLLLAALIAAAPRHVRVDVLADVLWPDGPGSANALQAQVSKLRRAIGSDRVVRSDAGYALDLTGADVDHRVLASMLEDARGRATDGAHEAALAVLDRAASMVVGEPLPELADHEHGVAVRAQITRAVDDVESLSIDSLVALDRGVEARQRIERRLGERPHDEHLWASLMVVEYRAAGQGPALDVYRRARDLLVGDLGVDPGPELVETERRILDQDPTLTGAVPAERPGVPSSLPTRLASIVGRDDAIATIAASLDDSRLVTVLGPGGMGKTTAAVEALRRHPNAVVVELAALPVGDDGVVDAIAAALGATDGASGGVRRPDGPEPSDRADRLVARIGERDLVILLDNCEHVVASAAATTSELLSRCANVRVLATSRASLGVAGERIVRLPPLDDESARDLFVERASASGADVTGEDPVVGSIVGRLDGLPLAIELAAARTRSLSPGELLAKLDDRFATLRSGRRTLDERQQTLHEVVAWSHELLEESERAVFRRLAACPGGASVAAATHVCADGRLVTTEAVDEVVDRLVDRSLVVVEIRPTGTRYRMLDTLREFAARRLAEAGESEDTMTRQSQFVAELLAPAFRGLTGGEQDGWLDLLGVERENIRAAIDVAVARADAETAVTIAAPVGWHAYMTGDFGAIADVVHEAANCPGVADPAARAVALATDAWLIGNLDDLDEARTTSTKAVGLLDDVDDPWTEAIVLGIDAMCALFAGQFDSADAQLSAARTAADRSGDAWVSGTTGLVAGEVERFRGDPAEAGRAFDWAAERFGEAGDRFGLALALTERSDVAEIHGEYERAAKLLQRGLEIAEGSAFGEHGLAMRARLGNVEMLRGRLGEARGHQTAVVDLARRFNMPWLRSMALTGLAGVERREGDPDAAERHLREVLDVPRNRSAPFQRALAQVGLGYAADQRGDAAGAITHQLAALEVHRVVGGPRELANSFEGLAGAFAAIGSVDAAEAATRLLAAADGLRRASGGPMPAGERFDVDRADQRARDVVADRWDTAWSAGRSADPDLLAVEMVELAGEFRSRLGDDPANAR